MRIKKSHHPSEYLKHRFRKTIKRMLRESRLNYINLICSSRDLNRKRFWSFFKIKRKISNVPLKVSVKSKENHNQRTYSNNNVDIANTFNEYFASIFTHDNHNDHNHEEHSFINPDIVLEDITLTDD